MTIDELKLVGNALSGATTLASQFPDIVFTSGRRSKEDQARAMAQNVVVNRKWIAQTYLANSVSIACQTWIDSNPNADTVSMISEGLLLVLNQFPEDKLNRLSKHLTGQAFDIQPIQNDGDQVIAAIQALPGLDKFLTKEGNLVRWHVQFV